jgi:ribose 5-phosphate isomerase A
LSWREDAKRRAALKAIRHIKNGYVIGLGSGSTVEYAIKELGYTIKRNELAVRGIPTSYHTTQLAIENGVPLTSLDEAPHPDIAIDGADQVDFKLNMIKGGGAALTREKIVDAAARQLIIIVDETKLTKKLGLKQHIPIEVLPFAATTVAKRLQKIGGKPTVRMAKGKLGPLITDNGNFILDTDFGTIKNAEQLENRLKKIPGIIETGLFIDMADIVYVGGKREVKVLKRIV